MIKNNSLFFAAVLIASAFPALSQAQSTKGWVSLFNGKSLNGWKASNPQGSFNLEDGAIRVAGPMSHLFYDGEVMDHNFKNFEIRAQVKTMPGSNSGFYFHTVFQDKGFPDKGFEVQVNNSHTDWKRTASLYDVVNIREVSVKDSAWFTLYIKVDGNHVTTKINDKTIVDYTQPDNAKAPEGHVGRLLSSGTFALQAHDPKSVVYYKDIMVKPLP